MNNEFEYRLSRPEEWDDVLDFGNFVFSQAHRPHDFRALLPKVYAHPDRAKHFVAMRGDRIRAMVANHEENWQVAGTTLRAGMIGTVSVHPYARGEGHMKKLMNMMMDDAVESGCDVLLLGGLRHRYGYFGFEAAGCRMNYTVTGTNLRHCCAEVAVDDVTFTELTEEKPEEVDFAWALAKTLPMAAERPREVFLDIMHSWENGCDLICIGGEKVGYVMGKAAELALTDEKLLPKVLKALMARKGWDEVTLQVMPYEKERIAVLTGLCERCSTQHEEQMKVLNWGKTLPALFRMAAACRELLDGEVSLRIDGEDFTLRVKDGTPEVVSGGAGEFVLTGREAVRRLTTAEGALCADARFKNWLPLPVRVLSPDRF